MSRYSKSFCRSVGFGMLMHGADKGGGSGGESNKTPTVPELTQRVKDLEAANQTLTTERDSEKQRADAAEAELKTEKEGCTSAKAALSTEQAAHAETKTKLTAAESAKAAAESAKATAEANLATADERAETRVREQFALCGQTLPAKSATEGNKTTEQESDKSKSPAQRLAASIKIAG